MGRTMALVQDFINAANSDAFAGNEEHSRVRLLEVSTRLTWSSVIPVIVGIPFGTFWTLRSNLRTS